MFANPITFLRPARPADCASLAKDLRPADRAELAASRPEEDPEALLSEFCRRSVWCWVLVHKSRPAAMFGLVPDALLGTRACVWLLTGNTVAEIAKTFFRTAKRFVAAALVPYAELYNFADERYTAALRFIRRLGGTFDGSVCQMPAARFLRFTFRRN